MNAMRLQDAAQGVHGVAKDIGMSLLQRVPTGRVPDDPEKFMAFVKLFDKTIAKTFGSMEALEKKLEALYAKRST